MRITVFIAEDDPDMRYVLRKVVEEVEGVRVIGEAGDGLDAIKLIGELAPQVVFVDIGIPGKDGVALAQEIFDINPMTFIVFATAFSEFREKAFDIYAFDYLVKPFKMNRVRQTMERVKAVLSGKAAVRSKPNLRYFNKNISRRQFFRNDNKFVYLNLDDVIYVTKEGRKSTIYFIGGQVQTNDKLSVLEEQLKGYPFFRSHSGFIVNLKMVKELIPTGRSSYELVMENTKRRPLITVEKFKELEELTNAKVPKSG
ncbi:LytTR family DNA-binding domain-containing protein [Pelotomaculum terephthalicicum JT]|uniref:LytR/AlgR family response regulator transcription factor n=1 Tax=Pelotomaculum TaxID=191373 RepID=UPI0009C73D4C|nr:MULTISPECIES: LytTR family DNA-binding domain-containing protein [Pelotomaculum]MCG9969058.1 LytTR family DNA-binding domain-containing protein [Pelotomaculum terephthalicicum JT]OPX87365.1 MAG: Transcriptional regulatory protein YpdB [Pelotomaculum sp. PtaB.Bin117]OPY62864.1 MAG: Transcriptional regulatory protein YpdB [Pelotomaculum sp. PtaU1.Bin065]